MNSYEDTKNAVKSFIDKKKYNVLAVDGLWGNGKTFLMSELVRENQSNSIYSTSLYVSLIGVGSIEALKLKLLGRVWSGFTGTMPILSSATAKYVIDELKVPGLILGDAGIKWFKKKYGISMADSVVLALPSYLTARLVIIDDIERIMESISLSELFGFINEFSEIHGTRFVLLMNESKLQKIEEWQTYFEKIVDRKIVLRPSVESLVEIPKQEIQAPFINDIKREILKVGVTSVRVIDKIFDMFNEIFEDRLEENDSFLSRIVPVGVLLSAIHYKSISSDISIEYILQKYRLDTRPFDFEDNKVFDDILTGLGIVSYVPFSEVFVKFLNFGVVDTKLASEMLSKLRSDAAREELSDSLVSLDLKVNWTKVPDIKYLENEAIRISRRFDELNHMEISLLWSNMKKLGMKDEYTGVISDWVHRYQDMRRADERYSSLNFFGTDGIHPFILNMDAKLVEEKKPRPTISEAIYNMSYCQSYSQADSDKVQAATIREIQMEMGKLDGHDLKLFVLGNFKHLAYNQDSFRSSAYEKFKTACHGIIENKVCPPLEEILTREFKVRNLDWK